MFVAQRPMIPPIPVSARARFIYIHRRIHDSCMTCRIVFSCIILYIYSQFPLRGGSPNPVYRTSAKQLDQRPRHMQSTTQRRSSTFASASPPPFQSFSGELFSDSRFHGYQGPSRNVRLPRATTSAGGTVAKSDDGVRCVVAGRECSSSRSLFIRCFLTITALRVLRLLGPEDASTAEQKSAVGRGGNRIDISKNLWDGSGLKIESTSTDVAWCSGSSCSSATRPLQKT